MKLFLRHALHAKLYLLHRSDKVNPMTAFVGSSNLTFHGLEKQGELNVDVLDHDACGKLANWFDARWNDKWCHDISEELIAVIEESWARPQLIPPYTSTSSSRITSHRKRVRDWPASMSPATSTSSCSSTRKPRSRLPRTI